MSVRSFRVNVSGVLVAFQVERRVKQGCPLEDSDLNVLKLILNSPPGGSIKYFYSTLSFYLQNQLITTNLRYIWSRLQPLLTLMPMDALTIELIN